MKKLKFENKPCWAGTGLHYSRRDAFEYSMENTYNAIDIGWLYVFFWDNKLREEFSE